MVCRSFSVPRARTKTVEVPEPAVEEEPEYTTAAAEEYAKADAGYIDEDEGFVPQTIPLADQLAMSDFLKELKTHNTSKGYFRKHHDHRHDHRHDRSPPGPTQWGIPGNCKKWHLITGSDENCAVAAEYDMTPEQFHNWNSAVSDDCTNGFWKDEAYCVGAAK
ncbi:hypothetical protein BJX99DRAFT_254869 [Aspergillus californicus]